MQGKPNKDTLKTMGNTHKDVKWYECKEAALGQKKKGKQYYLVRARMGNCEMENRRLEKWREYIKGNISSSILTLLSKEYYNLKLWIYLVKWMLLLVKRNLRTKSEVWESGQKFTKAWPSMSSHIHPFRWNSDKQNYFRDNCMVHFIIKQIGGTLSRDASLCLRKI